MDRLRLYIAHSLPHMQILDKSSPSCTASHTWRYLVFPLKAHGSLHYIPMMDTLSTMLSDLQGLPDGHGNKYYEYISSDDRSTKKTLSFCDMIDSSTWLITMLLADVSSLYIDRSLLCPTLCRAALNRWDFHIVLRDLLVYYYVSWTGVGVDARMMTQQLRQGVIEHVTPFLVQHLQQAEKQQYKLTPRYFRQSSTDIPTNLLPLMLRSLRENIAQINNQSKLCSIIYFTPNCSRKPCSWNSMRKGNESNFHSMSIWSCKWFINSLFVGTTDCGSLKRAHCSDTRNH